MMTSLMTFGITMLAGHFGFASAVPFILRGLGVARGILSATGVVSQALKPSAPRPDTNVGHIVVTDPDEQAWLRELLAERKKQQGGKITP